MISSRAISRGPITRVSACLAFVLSIGCLLAFASDTASAKRVIKAWMEEPIPSDAAPGSNVKVRWKMTVEAGGLKQAFGASEAFVRLVAPDRKTSRETIVEGNGTYSAVVEVPPGGIDDVTIGVKGISPSGGAASELIAPISGAKLTPRAPQQDDSDLSSLPLLAIPAVLTLSALFVLFHRSRRRYERDVALARANELPVASE